MKDAVSKSHKAANATETDLLRTDTTLDLSQKARVVRILDVRDAIIYPLGRVHGPGECLAREPSKLPKRHHQAIDFHCAFLTASS